MAIFTTHIATELEQQFVIAAERMVTEYRSVVKANRGNWERVAQFLPIILQVVATRVPMEITEIFPVEGDSSGYYLAHRCTGTGIYKAHRPKVQVVGLKNVTRKGTLISGERDNDRGKVVLLCPVVRSK